MKYYLYQIRNKVNGKCYIGVTNNPRQRYKDHFEHKTKGSLLICRALLKYGPNSFEFKILVIGDKEYIYNLEIKAIAKFLTQVPFGYNLTGGGEGRAGIKLTKEHKKKLRIAHLGKKASEKTKKRMRQSMLGKNSKKIMVANIIYNSMREAADAIDISYVDMTRCFQYYKKANKFPFGWGYI